jgi:hypothetical protein
MSTPIPNCFTSASWASRFDAPIGQPPQEQESAELTARAEAKFAEGETANSYSDIYTASTLFFASALFFAAISERFDYRRARIAMLAFACVGLIAGIAVALTQPITLG